MIHREIPSLIRWFWTVGFDDLGLWWSLDGWDWSLDGGICYSVGPGEDVDVAGKVFDPLECT